MKAVKKNTFYKSTTLKVGSEVMPNYSDVSLGGGSLSDGTYNYFELQGGYKSKYFALSGSVPSTPAYGQSELRGGYLSLYCTDVKLANTPRLPEIELYKMEQGIELSEGLLQIAHLSGNSAYSGIDTASNTPYPDGASISVYHSVLDADNYYDYENFDGANKTLGEVKILKPAGTGIVELGDAFLTVSKAKKEGKSVGSLLGQYKSFSLKKYFSNDDATVPIKPEGKDHTGVWRPQLDKRKDTKAKLKWRKPYWKYKDIKGSIEFKSKAGVGSDMDAMNTGTPGNTIFSEVYATADTNNPFTSDVNNPLMMTSCELSTAKKFSGGQAFRMYHLWDYSTESANLQKSLGKDAIMPSMTRASIYNLPQPHSGLDYAGAGDTGSPDFMGDASKILPEISMKMNISKLQFTPFIRRETGYGPTAGNTYYPSGTGASGGDADSSTNTSLLRSVVVTWSNYKPKTDHTTLDKFLDYGLERFYTGETTEHIVGGVAFMKTGIDLNEDPSTIYATALPVTDWAGNNGSSPTSKLLASGGLAKFSGLGTDLGDTLLVGCDAWVPSKSNGMRFVKLPMDSWFDMRTFIDGWAFNGPWSAQQNIYYKSGYGSDGLAKTGAPMRVFFKSDMVASGTVESDNPNADVPFLDVFFPCGTGPSGGARAAEYTFNGDPSFYPKHMTIWVQNYRWIEGSANATITYGNSYGTFYWGDNDGALPSGAAIEAELFIDDIKLKNFVPDVTNASAGASISTQQPISLRTESIESPYTKFWGNNSSLSGAPTSGASVRSFSTENQAYGATGSIYDVTATECIIMGFEDPGQLPSGPTAGGGDWVNYPSSTESKGFIMGNGFNTALYSNMERLKPHCFQSSVGNVANVGSDMLGGQFAGDHYYKGVLATHLADAGSTAPYANNTWYYRVFVTNDASNTENYSTGADGGTVYGNYGTDSQINYMTYDELPTTTASTTPSSMDGFTSKGLMKLHMSGSRDITGGGVASPGWVKREHIMCSTKITGIPGFPTKNVDSLSDYQIQVQDPTIFNKYQADEYIIFLINGAVPTNTTGSTETLGWGTSTKTLKLDEDIEIDSASGVITLNQDVTSADSGTDNLCIENNLSRLWISPKKWWVTWYQPANKTHRSYQNFCVVQQVGANGTGNTYPIVQSALEGSTYNESTYGYDKDLRGSSPAANPTNRVGMSGLYTKSWGLDPANTDTSLVTNQDYGYGSYDEESDSGGEVAISTAVPQKWMYMDLDGIAQAQDTSEDDNLVFLLGMNDAGLEQVRLVSDEDSDVTRVPEMRWEYYDPLPIISQPISLSPNYNILSGSGQNKVDLYKLDREELNAIKFNWREDADDITYRLLYIDSSPIQNKYHKIAFQAPLNELPAAGVATGSYYTGSARNAAGTFTTSTERTITGSSGWAYDGNLASSTSGVDWPQTAASTAWSYFNNTEATFIVHAVPRDGTTQTQGTLFTDNSTRGAFKIYYTKAASANADVTPVVSLTSGSTVVSGKTVTLTSDYSFPNDGESPLFIVVTFNANLDSNHIKMYVNGRLVKQSAGNWTKGNNLYNGASYDGRINIGNENDTGGTKKFRGTIQECIVHNKELHVPTAPDEYILPTTYLADKTAAGGTAIKYNARLFLFDYHNIIGTSRDTVCSSDEVSWEATPI